MGPLILVIDDDADFVEFVRIVLEAHDYQVDTTATANQGLAHAQARRPDVILLDAMISYRLDGLNLIETLRADPSLAAVPIILISAIVAPTDLVGTGVAADAFLAKPVEPAVLLENVQGLLSKEAA
jgi:DNA-binding response OmpR family regulator